MSRVNRGNSRRLWNCRNKPSLFDPRSVARPVRACQIHCYAKLKLWPMRHAAKKQSMPRLRALAFAKNRFVW